MDNLRQFNYIATHDATRVLNRFSNFFHWYYFPQDDAFAPSKFLGYKQTTIDNYRGLGSGGITQAALTKFFDNVDKSSQQFTELYQKLSDFAASLGKSVNRKTLLGQGEIYVPKEQYFQEQSEYSQQFFDAVASDVAALSEESDMQHTEGRKVLALTSRYERNPVLRAKAIKIHGTICKVCGFDFETHYGERGRNFIEVHHLEPLASLDEPSTINPAVDLTVLCANCHRMIHRYKYQVLSIEELGQIWKK